MKKNILFIIGIFIGVSIYSQNKQVLYGFGEIPQTLMLNPGAETNFKYHIGVPGLSGMSFNFGGTGAVVSDLFLADGIDFNTKLENVINQLDERDFLSLNLQIEILNGGYRLNNKTYFSFGFYEELDLIGYFPKDIAQLLYEGNAAYLNRSFQLSQILMRAEVLGVLHAGISYKKNSKLNIGARLKIYGGGLHINTRENSGTFTTREEGNNIYRHFLTNIDASIQSSGFYENDTYSLSPEEIISNSFFGGNLGLGVDIGFTYHYTPQIEFTGSVLDIGFVNYSKKIRNASVVGDYVFDGIEFLFDPINSLDYWTELEKDIEEKVPREENTNSYTAWRPFKFNAAVSYSFGKSRSSKSCYDITYKKYYNNTVGLQLFSITRPLNTQFAMTAFVEKNLGEKFHAKITYTVDDYSFSNIGMGMSTQIGIFHVYGMVDNILNLPDIVSTNSISMQFGINLIFN